MRKTMVKVYVNDAQSFQKALHDFSRQVMSSGVIARLKIHQEFKGKSAANRETRNMNRITISRNNRIKKRNNNSF
jgi:ribosomal protein S21